MNSKLFVLISILAVSGIMFGCSGENAVRENDGSPQGTRAYKLDPEARAMQISISGNRQGNSDADKFQFLMEKLRDSGEFETLIAKTTQNDGSDESGITLCGEFSSDANQTVIFGLIRSIETDPKSTVFVAKTVSDCSL